MAWLLFCYHENFFVYKYRLGVSYSGREVTEMQNTSNENQVLYQELVTEKQAEEKKSTIRTYSLISMIYMFLGE